MRFQAKYLRVLFSLAGLALAPSVSAESVDLGLAGYQHVRFEGIPTTLYANEGGGLSMQVKASSSLLLLPFAKARPVKGVAFEWRTSGKRAVKDAASEERKEGDDQYLRIGLLLAGPAPMMPFFAPAWIKAIRDHMKLPSDRVRYLAAGSHHAPGKTWKSPYGDSMETWAVGSSPTTDGWQSSHVSFDAPVEVVGLWLMADGDDTKSSFATRLRRLVFETP